MTPGQEGERLSKRVAATQTCSRREAEALIFAGAVQVNGQVVTDPARRVLDETVAVRRLSPLAAVPTLTVLVHQPPQQPITLSGLQDLVRREARSEWPPERLARLQAVLPLPRGTCGLCVFSDDPGILRHLQDPRAPLEHEWLATVQGTVDALTVQALGFPGFRVSLNRQTGSQTVLRIAGKAAQGTGMHEWLAERLPLLELRRQRIGRLGLAPLAAAQWRALVPGERF